MSDMFDEIEAEQKKMPSSAAKVDTDIFDQIEADQPKPTTVSGSLARAGKQILNIPSDIVKGTVGIVGGSLANLYEQFTTPLSEVPTEHRTSLWKGVIEPAGEAGKRIAEKVPAPTFDIEPAASTGQKIGDVAIGLGKFVSEIALLRKASPKTPEAVLWAYQALLNGESPATGYALGKAFGAIDKIPTKTVFQAGVKHLVESGSIAGLTAAEGGSWEDVAIAAAIPSAMKVGGRAYSVASKPFKPGPRVGVPGPDIIRPGQPKAPEEPPAAISAEGVYPTIAAQKPSPVEADARLAGQFGAEMKARQEAYEDLLDAIGSGDANRIAAARQEYSEAGPPTQEQVRKASDSGDSQVQALNKLHMAMQSGNEKLISAARQEYEQVRSVASSSPSAMSPGEAQQRLNNGYFQTDPVDTTSPLTKQERSIAKRLGYGKYLTGRQGSMTPGQVRLIIQGDQGALAEAPKPDPKAKSEPEVDLKHKPEAPQKEEKEPIIPEGQEPRSDFDRDVVISERRMNDAAARRTNKETGEISINWLKPVRDALWDIEAAVEFPIVKMKRRLEDRLRRSDSSATERFRTELEKQGVPDMERAMDDPVWMQTFGKDAQRIADMKHSGDWSQATPNELTVLNKLQALDAAINAPSIARLKWKIWKKTGEVPEALQADKEAAKKIFEEGQKAETEGSLDTWLAEQPWSSKKDYFMQEQRTDVEKGILDMVFGDKGAPMLSTGTAKTRAKTTKARQSSNILLDMIRHGQSIERAGIVLDEMPSIWGSITKSNLDKSSVERLKKLFKNVIGKPEVAGDWEKLGAQAKKLFWDLYFTNPRAVYRWTVQNLTQMSYMATHMSVKSLANGTSIVAKEAITGQRDPARIAASEMQFGKGTRVNQEFESILKDADNNFLERHPDYARISRPLRDMYRNFQRMAASSDPIMRELSWNMFYAATKDSLSKYQSGKIKWGQVSADLKLKEMHPTPFNQAAYYIRRGQMDKAAAIIAESKSSSTHGRYEISERSLGEQTVAGRLIPGPMVYLTGLYEMVLQQGIRPIQDGIKFKDYNMAYRGAKAMLATAAAYYFSVKAYQAATGKAQPFIAGWMPSRGPGISMLFDTIDAVQQVSFQAESQGWTPGQSADKMVDVLATDLERSIPIVDAISDFYEMKHDVKGVRLYTLIKSKLLYKWEKKYKKQWKPAHRTTFESVMHLLTGGYETGAEEMARMEHKQQRRPV